MNILYKFFLIYLLLQISNQVISQNITLEADKNITETTTTSNDALEIISYKLNNGLSVYLNPDPNMNSVYGAIVVRGGAKNDPEDATGIAHYLEHMLFKGTKNIGTIDYKSEKIWLDSIAFMYSMLPYTIGDENYRNRVYKKIDYYSQKASKYAIPGEFDKLIKLIGGKGLNAYTDFEKIVYYNEFPAEFISEWLDLSGERFQNAVFRLFQTELETVIEEKNMSQDNMYVSIYEEVYKQFFPTSTYGNRTVLGTVEHLQNPSLQKMATYYKDYYVSNNMALVLVGNFDIGIIQAEIERTFGTFRSGNNKNFKQETESSFDGRKQATAKLTPIPMGILGFRTPGNFNEDEAALDLIVSMLNNNQQTGFLDSLNKENKLLYSMTIKDSHSDLGGIFIGYAPKIPKQTLKGGEKLILEILNKIKSGAYSDEYLESLKKLALQNYQLKLENSDERMKLIVESFISNVSTKEIMTYGEKLMQIDKKALSQIANRYFGENYLAFYSKIGSSKKKRLRKPPLTPYSPKENMKSIYYNEFLSRLDNKITPKYITQDIDYKFVKINYGINLYHVNNPYNDIFNYDLTYYIGEYNLHGLEAAASYLNQVGTKDLPYNKFIKQLQKLGTTIEISANESFFMIRMTGFDSKFTESLIILNQLLTSPEVDNKANKIYLSERKIENRIIQKDLNMKTKILAQYSLYGQNSSYLKRQSIKKIRKTSANEHIAKIENALNYKVDIAYTGTLKLEMIVNEIRHHQKINSKPIIGNSPILKPMVNSAKNTIYYLSDKKALQSRTTIIIPTKVVSQEDRLLIDPFNNYFGQGLNSLVFREIREYKSLAYTAYAKYIIPYKFGEPGYLYCFSATQSDKTEELLNAFYYLLDSLKITDNLYELKISSINSINTNKPNFRYIASHIAHNQLMGYSNDPREEEYNFYLSMKEEEIQSFYDNYIRNNNKRLSIIGLDEIIKTNNLVKFGEIMKIKLKNIYTK
jgi:zinc protease